MTRQNKCDACRKAKVKCDEILPRCSGCVRRGRECSRTHSSANKDVRFVEVKGEVVDGAVNVSATRSSEVVVPLNILDLSSPANGRIGNHSRGASIQKMALPQLTPLFPNSEQFSLLARWTSVTYKDLEGPSIVSMDNFWCFKNWTTCIPRYIGTSLALDDAVKCYLNCKLAFANPTNTNLLAVRTSKFKAVNSVRLALETRQSQPIQNNILIAVHLMYMVEALILQSHSTMVTHVKGLITLLNEHKKNLDASDVDGNLISGALLISTYNSGLFPALITGTDHDLDKQNYVLIQPTTSNLQVISRWVTQQAWQTMVQSYVAIPRLARLTRQLQTSPGDEKFEHEVISLAQHLNATTLDPNFLSEATSLGQLWVEPTTFSGMTDIIPTSYGFKSRKLVGLLAMYWMARLLICGLVEKLITTTSFASGLFNANAVEAEDIDTATRIFMMVQYGFTGLAGADNDTIRVSQLQLLSALQTAFGAWYRMEKRAMASKEGGEEVERKNQQARMMKQLCLDLGNQLVSHIRFPPMTMISLEMISEMFAGGPIIQCDLPEE